MLACAAFASSATIPLNIDDTTLITKAIDQGIGFNNLISLAGHIGNWVTQAQRIVRENKKSSKNEKISAEETIKIIDQTLRNTDISALFKDITDTIKVPDIKKGKDTFRAKRDRAIEATTRTLDTLLQVTKNKVDEIIKENECQSSQVQQQLLTKAN